MDIPQNYIDVLQWIVGIFRQHNIPYVLTGGTAARIYGSPRRVIDLDFDIPDQDIQSVADSLKQYVVSGPEMHTGGAFTNILLELEYNGVPIDIGGADSPKTFNRKNKTSVTDPTDINRFNMVNIGGGKIRVVPREDLILYKNKLSREVDLKDVKAMKKQFSPPTII